MNANLVSTPIDFMRFRWLYFSLSLAVIIPGLICLSLGGLRFSIDFTGGTLLEIALPASSQLNDEQLRQALPEGIHAQAIQQTAPNQTLLRTSPMTKDQALAYRTQLASPAGGLVEEVRFETVGPVLGQELIKKTVLALIISGLAIMAYVAFRFKNLKYGLSAIVAMFHDSLIVIGSFAILGYFFGVEIDTLFVTALLTILSFSVHDTIVVYDRIRENQRRQPTLNYYTTINKALTETMGRSLNNSMTIVFMLLALLLFGGQSIRHFTLALLIGTLAGTYSSPFVAAPLLLLWDKIFVRANK